MFPVKKYSLREDLGLGRWPSQYGVLHKPHFTCCRDKNNLKKERSVWFPVPGYGLSWQENRDSKDCWTDTDFLPSHTYKWTCLNTSMSTHVTHTLNFQRVFIKVWPWNLFYMLMFWMLVLPIVVLFWRSRAPMVVGPKWKKSNTTVDLWVIIPRFLTCFLFYCNGNSLCHMFPSPGTERLHHTMPFLPWWTKTRMKSNESFRFLVVSVGYSAQSDA